jgi:DNA-3-methyladenine glycosylase I
MCAKNISGCTWPGEDALMLKYHDEEWGTPLHDDRKLFEFMILDAFQAGLSWKTVLYKSQAGLSWKTVLYKRENFRKAFSDFDVNKIAKYNDKKIESLLQDVGIIRNKLKVASTITNAKAFLEVQKEFGSFDKYIWQFTDHKTIHNGWKQTGQVPPKSAESDAMSKDLLKRGFKFVGSTICYAFMQAAGMVNDHLVSCYRYNAVKEK